MLDDESCEDEVWLDHSYIGSDYAMLDVQGCDDEVGLDYHYIGLVYRYTRPTVGTPGGGLSRRF